MKEQLEKPIQQIQTLNNNYGDGWVLVNGGSPIIHIHNDGKESRIINGEAEMPEELQGDRVIALLAKFQEAGMLNENYQPVDLSSYECAVLAQESAWKLWGENRWKPFEDLWGMSRLASKYDRALGMRKTSELITKIKNIIND